MDTIKIFLDWSASIAWPLVTVSVVLMFRAPLFALLERLGSIADRASRESFDLQLGEKLKISFRDAIQKANPQTVEEAVAVAEEEVDKALSIFELLSRIPMQKHHKDLLLKISKGGDAGLDWHYKGPSENAPGRTMGFLLDSALVHRKGDRYFVHPAVRDFIFETHANAEF